MGKTYDEFIKTHVGKAMDYDGVAGAQCVDLAKYYLDEVFGIKPGAWGNAHAYFDNFDNLPALKKNFKRIRNTPDLVPKKGDIGVWDSGLSSGGWGHIAICTGEGDTKHFTSYDQNWTGNHDACTKVNHNYQHFAGVLRPIDQTKVHGEPEKPKKEKKTLDTRGFQYGANNAGVLAYKELLLMAYDKKLVTIKVDENCKFGKGTRDATNQLLKKWRYKQNGIMGPNLVKRLMKELKK